jgi:hypothetical protein
MNLSLAASIVSTVFSGVTLIVAVRLSFFIGHWIGGVEQFKADTERRLGFLEERPQP